MKLFTITGRAHINRSSTSETISGLTAKLTKPVSLTNPQVTLGTGTEGSSLSFQVNGGPEVKLLDLDASKLEQSALPNGTLDLQNLLAADRAQSPALARRPPTTRSARVSSSPRAGGM